MSSTQASLFTKYVILDALCYFSELHFPHQKNASHLKESWEINKTVFLKFLDEYMKVLSTKQPINIVSALLQYELPVLVKLICSQLRSIPSLTSS